MGNQLLKFFHDIPYLNREFLSSFQLYYAEIWKLSSFFVHVDASGWTNAFRNPLVEPFGIILDPWIYDLSMTLSLDRLQYQHHGCVKGDDAKYAINVPVSEIAESSAGRIADNLAAEVQAAISSIGHEGKIEETLVSQHLLSFGKKWCLDKIFLPNMFKNITKVHGYGDAPFPNFSSRVGTAFATAHAACSEGNVHIVPHFLAVMSSLCHFRVTYGDSLSHDESVMLLITPSSAGGMSILLLSDFFINSESDQLTKYLSLCNSLLALQGSMGDKTRATLSVPFTPYPNPINICKDPYSVPIKLTMEAHLMLKDQVAHQLQRVVRNQQQKTIFHSSASLYDISLRQSLESMDHYNAKAISELRANSISGLKEDVLALFESARTMIDFLVKTRMRPRHLMALQRKLLSQEVLVTRARLTRMRNPFHTGHSLMNCRKPCAAEWAQLSRDTAWEKSVIGVTYPDLSEQFGVFLVNEEDYQLSSGVSIGSTGAYLIHINVSGSYSCREGDDNYRNGPKKPFFGKKTPPRSISILPVCQKLSSSLASTLS